VWKRDSWADDVTVQCPNEKCRNDEAYWYQLQIRSADEPMTAFYKVYGLESFLGRIC
jgi:DNA-directed RNA polymerase III subunit RPC11